MISDLEPLLGRRLSVGVVPNWDGQWPLAAHPEYCTLLKESSEELLLHGYYHRRQRGWGPTSLFAERCDEMNGLGRGETWRTIDLGQRDFRDVFGKPARTFLAPGWQAGHVLPGDAKAAGIDHLLGFFSIDSSTGRRVPLATFTWDCGRWGWLGHIGSAIGHVLQLARHRVPVLAIHPRDLQRGFWPPILELTRELLSEGYEPRTVAGLVETNVC